MQGILGKKIGMTQVFDPSGAQVPVTVVEVGPCVVVQRKRAEKDGYDAVQLGYGVQKPQRLSKSEIGHCRKAGDKLVRTLREFRVPADSDLKEGDILQADLFDGVAYVDITAQTKGRGFQGVMKRHNMAGQPASHGHTMHRRTGSIGALTKEGRVWKGKRMPGHMGNTQVTTLNLKVQEVLKDDNVLLVRGAVPGPNGGLVVVRKALKKAAKAS